MNFGKLAEKVGNTGKEAARNGLVDGLLNVTGNSAMNGRVNYSEYEYDANGHIKGVNNKYVKEVENRYERLGLLNESDIDGNYGGLSTSVPRVKQTKILNDYPHKYKEVNYSEYGSEQYANAAAQYEKSQEENNNKLRNKYAKDPKAAKSANLDAAKKPSSNDPNAPQQKTLEGLLFNDISSKAFSSYGDNDDQNKVADNPISDLFTLKLPDWSYADFINERAIWQKGLSSIFDEPGWFYFKIFFDFDTDHGLFGGLLNSKYLTTAVNSAAKYLYSVRNIHRYAKPLDRINALYKFTSTLSYINTNAPWYFKSVKGLNNAANPIMNDFSKENSIELEVTQDAIDMRLSTLMSLYNYACYDPLLDKEIIPTNLRKFNMSIIIFQTPLRYLHTSFTSNKKMEFMGIDLTGVKNELNGLFGKNKKSKVSKVNYKSMNPNHGQTGNYADTMSMKVYTFIGCEFTKDSLANIIPGSIQNDSPFQLGNSSIKITYNQVTEHTMNEFYGMMFGSDGFYFNQYSNFQLSLPNRKGTWNGYNNRNKDMWAKQLERYKALYDMFEDVAQGGSILGLVDKPKTYKKAIDATEAIMNGLFDNPGMLKGLATNFALGLLGSSKDTRAPQGNIYGDYGIGSAYYKDKLEMLKNGVHERTQAPYYYDPDTGVKHELHKNKQYSAYNYKNDVNSISTFNLNNFLQTSTQKYASQFNDSLRTGVDSLFGYDTSKFTQQPYKPNQYNKDTAQEIDNKKWEGIGKSHEMIDDPNTWDKVTKPYTYTVPTYSTT